MEVSVTRTGVRRLPILASGTDDGPDGLAEPASAAASPRKIISAVTVAAMAACAVRAIGSFVFSVAVAAPSAGVGDRSPFLLRAGSSPRPAAAAHRGDDDCRDREMHHDQAGGGRCGGRGAQGQGQ